MNNIKIHERFVKDLDKYHSGNITRSAFIPKTISNIDINFARVAQWQSTSLVMMRLGVRLPPRASLNVESV